MARNIGLATFEDLLAALADVSDSGDPVLSPKLQEVELSGCGHYRGESVLKMVEARRLAGRPLRAYREPWASIWRPSD
ncbi:hypothetical protein BD626DRAFT_484349 [Schizophyllum amplum]|uniref:Uncharacterized protein n=1 Tax=Schizophyllum amplum TaxID=97359 RepID=A0A550CQ78_9AGAR|nr:hypothetical protein BD626DRAFT_484349 [Auriculariopsis ampla]